MSGERARAGPSPSRAGGGATLTASGGTPPVADLFHHPFARVARFGLAFGGAYAEYIAVNEGMVTIKPDGVSWVQAAAVCENWLTA